MVSIGNLIIIGLITVVSIVLLHIIGISYVIETSQDSYSDTYYSGSMVTPHSIASSKLYQIIQDTTASYGGTNCNNSETPMNCFATSFDSCSNAILSNVWHAPNWDPYLDIVKINSTSRDTCSIDWFHDIRYVSSDTNKERNMVCRDMMLDQYNQLHLNKCMNESGEETTQFIRIMYVRNN